MALAVDVITAFLHEGFHDIKLTTEALRLASVVDKNLYRHLLAQLASEESLVLDPHQLACLAQVIRSAPMECLEAADLVKILEILQNRLNDIHQQPHNHTYELALSVSSIIDGMADSSIKGLDSHQFCQYLSGYVDSLKATPDSSLVYQAAYTYQALQHIADEEAIWIPALQLAHKPFSFVDNPKAIDVKDIIQKLQDGYDGLDSKSNKEPQQRSRASFVDCLDGDCSFECKRSWYPAIRTADALLHEGQFAEFKELALEAPCRLNPAFQWGLCQLLGDLAANLEWDTKTRLNAVAFLKDILQNDAIWGQHGDIKDLVISILTQLVSLPESVKQAAETVLQQWETPEASAEQSMNQQDQVTGRKSNPFSDVFPSLATPSLLDRVQDTPGVENRLLQLRKQRLADQQDAVYVDPQAKEKAFDLARFPLMDKAKDFLASDRTVFLLLGGPGSGKSIFIRVLERDLWKSYERMESHIPLYVDMSVLEQPIMDPISRSLLKSGFTEGQVKELKDQRKFILICDEYDYIPQPYNLYTANKLNQPGEWNAKLIVCCRSEHLGSSSFDLFQPTDRNSQVQPDLFQQAIIEPFDMEKVQDYINQYTSLHKPLWQMDDYLGAFERDRCLQDLSRNPLLLSLTLDVLPRLVASQQELSVKRFNKVAIYDQIVAHWFERSKERLRESTLVEDDTEGLGIGDFVQNGIDYLKQLAAAIYKNQGGIPVVEYSYLNSRFKQDEAWKEDFFGQSSGIQIIRKASPLKCSNTKFQFIHPSILEYGLTLSVYDPQEIMRAKASRPILARRRSSDSVMSFESNDSDDEATTTIDQGPDHGSPLIWRNFVNDQLILEFLEDRVQQEPSFKQKLMAFIELSKTEKKWRTAAANAITILVGAGVSFNGADLRDIQVPGADLSHGMFESAHLQGADLRKTNLQCAWLYNADLSQAQMKGVRFGELPYLSEDKVVCCCAYSPDGRYFAVGLVQGYISLYTTSNLERIRTHHGHHKDIHGVAFSTNGLMVSGSSDKTARLWDIETGSCIRTLIGHTDCVYGVAFSLRGDLVATGGGNCDKTVRLWDVGSGACQHIMSGHRGPIWSIIFSPNGLQVTSGSGDKTLRLWDVETGTLHSILSGHERTVISVAYSPQGHLIASASNDSSVRLWDVESGTCQKVLHGHSGSIKVVAFSPQGNLILSADKGKSVRLWDVKTGSCQSVFSGCNEWVSSVVFSPERNQIAFIGNDKTVRFWNLGATYSRRSDMYHGGSIITVAASSTRYLAVTGGNDKTLRLWDMRTEAYLQSLSGHSKCISGVAFSPTGDQVASGSYDKTVRLWDVETGVCRHILNGHTDYVRSVAFSPSGDLVASGSDDKSIRLWDAQSGHCNQTIQGHTGHVKSVAFSSTGDRIASGSADYTVRLWNAETGNCIRTFSGHSHNVLSVAFSPTGNMMASCSSDKTVRLWDTNAGSCRHILSGHEDWVKSVVFSPNGDRVASGGGDKSVRLWSAASGQSLAVIRRFQGPVNCLAWCTKSDREYLVAGEENGALHFCEIRKLPEGEYDVSMCWMSPRRLDATDATVRDVHGLTDWDKRLLKQRGAVDVPALNPVRD
ncbi:hypothetical protein BGX31_009911 [Mortierella sp. GBA43]|nr:hypothetical protein BGX31_009911 [Mortierella sp. GBA43]